MVHPDSSSPLCLSILPNALHGGQKVDAQENTAAIHIQREMVGYWMTVVG